MPKPLILCKLCGKTGLGADSHVIAEAFYRLSKGTHDHLKVVSNIPLTRPSKSRIGFYDKNLLCLDCESKFQSFDDYGIRVLLGMKREPLAEAALAEIRAELIRDVDRQRFNEFLAFQLWRVLASDLPPFRKVVDRQLEQRLQGLLMAGSAGTTAVLQAVVNIMCHNLPMLDELNLVLNGTVYRADYLGVPTVNIGLGNLLLMVNLGQSSFQSPFDSLAFPGCFDRTGSLLLIGSEEFSNRHIRTVQQVTQQQAKEVKILDMARRVRRRFPHPCVVKGKGKSYKT